MSRRSEGIASFVAGALVGVGAGMLLAPKSGEELRKDLLDKASELIDKAKNIDSEETVAKFLIKLLKHILIKKEESL